MLRQYIGDIGHLSVIISFITSIVAALAYYNATQAQKDSLQKDNSWLTFARIAFAIHGIAVMGIVLSLFTIIYKNYFEFHYAWEHASKNLPTHFMISCFWEGQEGSFLLWIFWHVILGGILIRTNKAWEAPVMICLGASFFGFYDFGGGAVRLQTRQFSFYHVARFYG